MRKKSIVENNAPRYSFRSPTTSSACMDAQFYAKKKGNKKLNT